MNNKGNDLVDLFKSKVCDLLELVDVVSIMPRSSSSFYPSK